VAFRWPWQKKQNITQILKTLGIEFQSKSGASVTLESAIKVTTVLACARVIAEGIAQIPLKLYRERPGGGREPMPDHPVYRVLARRPNEWQTAYEFREMMGIHLALCGNFYAFINSPDGRITELLPFEPGAVTVKRDGWNILYKVRMPSGEQQDIPASQMWHVRGATIGGVVGLDFVQMAREAIGLAMSVEEHGSRMFANGARPGGILTTAGILKKDQVNELRESWEQMQGGSANAYRTAILWGGLDFKAMAMPNDQAQMLELRKFQVEEICRAYRVMPIMVGYSDKTATYASAEQMFLSHVVHTMGPWYSRIEQSGERNLLTEKDRDGGLYLKFNVSALLRGAHADRANYFKAALGSGGSPPWMTQDEVRELEELNPFGGEASRLPRPMQSAPTGASVDSGGDSNAPTARSGKSAGT